MCEEEELSTEDRILLAIESITFMNLKRTKKPHKIIFKYKKSMKFIIEEDYLYYKYYLNGVRIVSTLGEGIHRILKRKIREAEELKYQISLENILKELTR